MGKEFVVKHIRLKHAARMEQELSKVAPALGCMHAHQYRALAVMCNMLRHRLDLGRQEL